MENYSMKEVSLRDVLRVFFRYKLQSVIIFITIMITVYIALQLRIPIYQSQVTILVAGQMQKDVEVQRALGPGSLIATQMSMVNSRPIIERSVKALQLDQRPIDYKKKYATKLNKILIEHNVKKLKRRLTEMTPKERQLYHFYEAIGHLSGSIGANQMGKTSMFKLTATDYSARGAALIANVVSRAYIIFDLEQQIAALKLIYGEKNETIKKLNKFIVKLEETLDGRILPDVEAIGHASVKIVSQAGPGQLMRKKPTEGSAYMVAFIMSVVTSVAVALGLDFFNDSIKSPLDVKRFLNIPFLGSIPKRRKKGGHLIEYSNLATKYNRSYQKLSNRLYVLMKNNNLKTILFCEAEGSKENVAVIANLGVLASKQAENKVLIIDADLRSSALSDIFNISNTPGLAGVLEGGISFENAIQDMGLNLSFLPAGKTDLNPLVLLESSAMSDIVRKSKKHYDITYINCADLSKMTEGVMLSSITDGFVFIVNADKIKCHFAKQTIAPIEKGNVKILGVIINNFRYVIPEIFYRLT